MAGLFSRLKIWNPGETLTASDLNAEFNQFLANIDALHSEGYSANLSQMQQMEDPGNIGTENLTQPISVAQEIQRLRFVIDRIIGLSQWYQPPGVTLQNVAQFIDQVADFSPSRIESGKTTTLSDQANFLQAGGSNGVAVVGTPVNLIYYIDGVQYTLTANAAIGGLNPAPGAGNTATLSSVFLGDQFSRGVDTFAMSGVGPNISSRIGLLSGFSIVNGGNTEYFIGTPTSDNTIVNIPRGFLFDTSGNQIPAISLTTGHTITVMELTYVFLRFDGTLDVTYNPPIYSPTAPSVPSAGDYWYDTVNSTWKKYQGGAYILSKAVFAGICMQDSSGNVVASRSPDFSGFYEDQQSISFSTATSNSVSAIEVPLGQHVSVYGYQFRNNFNRTTVSMPSNLYGSETEQASTIYYVYFSRKYEFFFSEQKPIYRPDILGYYHPCESFKAIGQIYNDSGSNFLPNSLAQNLGQTYQSFNEKVFTWEINGNYGVLTAPQNNIDLIRVIPYPIKIKNIFIYSGTHISSVATSGTTTFDIKVGTSTGSYSSIFSTLGSIGQTAITSITRVGTTATATLNNHGFSNGNQVRIIGATQTEYNGLFTISNVSANTFDYTIVGAPATPATGSPALMPKNEIYTDSGSIIAAQTGVVKPILNQTVFQAGQALRADLTTIMVNAQDCKIMIYYEAL